MDQTNGEGLRALLAAAGDEALQRFRDPNTEHKSDGSVVTEADRAAEEVLVEGLQRLFPDDAIVAEEGARVAGRSRATWHVDPIDGTGAFVGQLAYWGPTCARVAPDGGLDLGAFYLPRLGEFWFAARGEGAFRDGQRLRPDNPVDVASDAILMVPSRVHRMPDLRWPGKVRSLGSSAAHLAHVAAGGALGALVPKWALWDVGCGALLVREAGRVIWDTAGAAIDAERCTPGLPLLAGAPTVLRVLRTE